MPATAFSAQNNAKKLNQVVYPVHLNSVVRCLAAEGLVNDPRIHLIKPLDVIDFHNFAASA
jgi:UDP-N-acetylglucosamine 2-epimerase (non-hydrolysing)